MHVFLEPPVKTNYNFLPTGTSSEKRRFQDGKKLKAFASEILLESGVDEKSLGVSRVDLQKVHNRPEERKFSGLGPSCLKIVYPLLSSDEEKRKILLIDLFSNRKESYRNLLWKLIFKGINVIEFMILDELMKKRWGNLEDKQKSLLTILFYLCSNTRKRLTDINSQMRPIFKKVPTNISVEFFPESTITNFLKIPEKGSKVIYSYEYKTLKIKNFPSSFRIGKGYTDQGGLSPVGHLAIEQLKGYELPWKSEKYDEEFLHLLLQNKENFSLI